MLRKFILNIFILISACLVNAQESLLWKITSPDGKLTSYVLSTTELPGVENYDIATPAAEIMNEVNTVAFFSVPDVSEIENIPIYMKSSGGNTLKGFYKREDRIRFELMVSEKLRDNVENYHTTKPLYILQLFREKDHAAGLLYQQTILLDIALQKAKPTLSMLTIRQIGSTMDGMDFQSQAFILSDYVNNVKTFRDADAKKFNAYTRQSLSEYASIINSTEQSGYINVMINDINDLLIKKIEALSTQQTVLYVLNTDLVGGESGILKKLRNKGFGVVAEPFNYTSATSATIKNNTTENNSNNTIVTSTQTTFPDDFPSIILMPTNSGYLNPEEIKVVNINEISNVRPIYKAYSDPFGDLTDMSGADTLFMEYWFDLKGIDANFKVKVPIKNDWEKTETEQRDGGIIKKYIYQTNHAKSDLFYSVGYTLYPPTFTQSNKSNFFDQFMEQTEGQINGKVIAQRILSTPAYTGREFTAVVGDSFFVRSQFILQENVLYQLLVGGPGDNPYSTYAEAFLNSFTLSSNAMVNWHFFDQPSFNTYLPTPPNKSTKTYTLPTGPLTVQTYASEDYKDLVSYSVVVSTYPPGHKFGNKATFFEDLISTSERQLVGTAYKTEKVKLDGIEGRYVEMQLMNKKTYRMYFFLEGNITYQFVAGGEGMILQSLNVNRFFNSIHFKSAD